MPRSRSSRRSALFTCGMLALVTILYGLGSYFELFSRFDKEVWLTHNEMNSDNPRLLMASDLLTHHLPPGLAREQVVRLLGEVKGESFVSEKGVYFYMLGTSYGDPSFVCVEFDGTGHLHKAWRFDR